jgi:hypothetical protein
MGEWVGMFILGFVTTSCPTVVAYVDVAIINEVILIKELIGWDCLLGDSYSVHCSVDGCHTCSMVAPYYIMKEQ